MEETIDKAEYHISTDDNPFNPFKEFDKWNAYDEQMGYYSLNVVTRFLFSSPDIPEDLYQYLHNIAIDEVIENVATGTDSKFIKVSKVA